MNFLTKIDTDARIYLLVLFQRNSVFIFCLLFLASTCFSNVFLINTVHIIKYFMPHFLKTRHNKIIKLKVWRQHFLVYPLNSKVIYFIFYFQF